MRNKMKLTVTLLSIVSIAIFTIKIVDENKYKSQLRKEIREFVQAQEQSKILEAQKLAEAKVLEEQKLAETKALEVQKLAETQVQNAEFENQPYIQLQRKIQKQAEIDKMLLEELESNQYTLENPFIVVDPYGESPLTALILFTTKEAIKFKITVKGDSTIDNLEHSFDEFSTKHIIPVYALYQNKATTIVLEGVEESGKTSKIELEIEADGESDFLDNFTLITKMHQKEIYGEGLNFVYFTLSGTAFDSKGEWRFLLPNYHKIPLANFPKNTEHGFFYYLGAIHQGDGYIVEINPLGKILNIYHTPYGVHHELTLTERNTLILSGANTKTPYYLEDYITEVDLSTGKIINALDYKDMLQIDRGYGLLWRVQDWLHHNATIDFEGDMIMSSRHQHLIMRHNWDKEIKWMLSDPKAYLDIYKEYLLTPIGENFEYSYDQHAPELLPDLDNNPDTIDILLFDNGYSRNNVNTSLNEEIALGKTVAPPLYSRMVHYRINEKDMTVEQIWQYGKERPELFSAQGSDANMLPNGNIYGLFRLESFSPYTEIGIHPTAGVQKSATIVEVDKNADEVWQVLINNKSEGPMETYRAEKFNIYTPNANNLHLGEKAGIFLPEKCLLEENK